jgi:hypothetical protein
MGKRENPSAGEEVARVCAETEEPALGKVAHLGLLLVVLRVAGVLAAALHEGALVRIGVGVLGVRVEELLADLAGSDGGRVLAVEDVDWRGEERPEDQLVVLVPSSAPRREKGTHPARARDPWSRG